MAWFKDYLPSTYIANVFSLVPSHMCNSSVMCKNQQAYIKIQ